MVLDRIFVGRLFVFEAMLAEWIKEWGNRMERFAQFTVDVIYDRRHGPAVRFYAAVLRVFSVVFSGIVQMRYLLYNKRIIRDQPLGCLVVVVGNLTVGGTGKTPVTEKFARTLHERGRRVAILSRGYKSREDSGWWCRLRRLIDRSPVIPRVVSDGERVLLDSEQAGDEPYMLARNLPGVVVLVDKDRVRAGQYAIKKFKADTLILDDGFQYLPLRGQLNLLLIDKSNPFGNRRLLPRGILREPVKHLRRASYIFVTKSDGVFDPELQRTIQRYKPEAEIIECAHRPQYLKELRSEQRLGLDTLKGRRIGALSAIAVPESFEGFLRDLGAQIVVNERFLDHHRFSEVEMARFLSTAREANVDMVVVTEKDAVRIPDDWELAVPVYFLRLEVEILSGVKDFEEAVSRLCFPSAAIGERRVPGRNTRPQFKI